MDVYVRLYWQHDLDLIALHYSPSVPKVGYLMKEALAAHVRNTPYEIYVPDKIMFRKPIKSCNANIKLYEGKDDDLIEYVKSLHYGLRSNAMKQILRNYLSHMFILPYAQGSGVYFQTRIHSNKKKNVKINKKAALNIEKQKTEKNVSSKKELDSSEDIIQKSFEEAIGNTEEKNKEDLNSVQDNSLINDDTEINTVSENQLPDNSNSDIESDNTDFDLFGAVEAMI